MKSGPLTGGPYNYMRAARRHEPGAFWSRGRTRRGSPRLPGHEASATSKDPEALNPKTLKP